MDLIQSPYIPASLNTVERSFVFDYFTLHAGLFGSPSTNEFPHRFLESDANYAAPILNHRVIQTPTHGMRLILNASMLIDARHGFMANGIWNHALPIAGNLILPIA